MGFPATVLLLSIILSAAVSSFALAGTGKVGICYGQLGDNLPTPTNSIELMKTLKVKQVKIYDANPAILTALKGSDIVVLVMVPNQLLVNISTNQSLSDDWIRSNVVPFYPSTKIQYVLVGNEILSSPDRQIHLSLVPSMFRIRKSLVKFGLRKIKVATPSFLDILESSYPPSNGTFRADISNQIIKPMLQFLNQTKSFFLIDVYPYFAWAADPVNIKLDYALLSAKNITVKDPGTGLTYTNLLDQMIDAVYFAMKRMGYPKIRIFIAETGWPNGGDVDQIGANIYNSATYNRNVVKKFTAKPAIGTPAMPGAVIPALVFALYNENLKPGQGSERHFGVLYPNGSSIYGLDFSGKTDDAEYGPLPAPTNNEVYKGKVWCVVRNGGKANRTEVGAAMAYACGQGNGTCDPIKPRGVCYRPDSFIRQASYAFSAYWAQFKKLGGSCYFNGLAEQTIKDPSYGLCKFPSVTF
ncbi:probable glucan endo-1,3-beta-glucosidase A6 isoform X2 [Impatiens glandulifera]|uniref:probable glucan endo-1,3-beta-glucosidase A6 isoform X2 n=1 Tax=Impatiens glandulifera TaxID=253017 RepID=UPI001FB11AA5|nr:probable glucan endo-1,3-beta-glucosidase A6 isoform X2 [Impatiens glandulifera]